MAAGDDARGLPGAYGRSRVVLMAVDPFHLHVYWEVTPEDRERARGQLEPDSEHEPPIWVLRFHDVSQVEFDGTNAHGYFDVPVDLAVKNWYVELWSSDKTYFAELGPRSDADFVAACRSNFEYVPRAEPSPRYEPTWQSAPPTAPGEVEAEAALDPPPVPAAAEESSAEQEGVATPATAAPARPPAPALARQPRSFSVSLQGGSGSGSSGGRAR